MAIFKLRLLADEEQEEVRLREELDEEPSEARLAKRLGPTAWYWTLAVALGAALPRLYYLFRVSDPSNPGDGMYGDVYHHWQIAYLTKEIGWSHGLRLWDLKGLEYFWGILHPWLMAAIFTATGSIDIVQDRLLSLVFGVLAVVLVFLLCRRHWGTEVALASAAFAALAPTSIFNDASGMVEPLGVALCLLAVWLLPRHGFLAGITWGLATMARAEAWVFTVGLVVAVLLTREGRRQAIPLLVGWGAVMLFYMKFLLDQTGDPIYPVYWNFLANVLGKWEFTQTLTPDQRAVQPWLGVILAISAVALAITLWKRPRPYLLLTFGFGYWVFVAGMLGFTSYLRSWVWWMPITRVFAFPYDFAAVVLAIGLLYLAPRYLGRHVRPVSWTVVAAALVVVQVAWLPIQSLYSGTYGTWKQTQQAGAEVAAAYHQPGIDGGAITLPSDHPNLTYAMARFDGVQGRHLVSDMYDPFYYLPAGYSYDRNPDAIGTQMACWFASTGTTLFVVDRQKKNYALLLADHPGWFGHIGAVNEYDWQLYRVQAPRPSAASCKEAARATRP